MTAYDFSISGQHYLFDVQSFAHTILAAGGDSYSYALRDRTTQGVIDDVALGTSELGVVMLTSATEAALTEAFTEAGLTFHELAASAPLVALPSSHPLVNAKKLSLEQLADYPYVYFDQGEGAPVAFFEEALSDVPRAKKVACTDRASLTELRWQRAHDHSAENRCGAAPGLCVRRQSRPVGHGGALRHPPRPQPGLLCE